MKIKCYKTHNGGFILTTPFPEKELVLFIGNFESDGYYSEEERVIGEYGNKDPWFINPDISFFKEVDIKDFTNTFYKWFIQFLGSGRASYIKSAMRSWGIL